MLSPGSGDRQSRVGFQRACRGGCVNAADFVIIHEISFWLYHART